MDNPIINEKAHARLSASSSVRWLNCPASVSAADAYPESSSAFAAEGTCAHELAEICLKNLDKSPEDFVGSTLSEEPEVEVDSQMAEYIDGYKNYCLSIGGYMMVERRVDFSEWVPDGFGTADCIVFDDDTCHVVDLKYGQGVDVYADDNSQLMLYALGVYSDYSFLYENIQGFVLHIYQPRKNNIGSWEISIDNLLKWGEWVKERALLCDDPNAEFNPSEKACQWCPHMANCEALNHHANEVICADFDDLTLPEPTDKKINVLTVIKNKKLIESWLDAVQKNALSEIMDGGSIAGLKVVRGRSNRYWTDEAAAAQALSGKINDDELYSKKMLSPSKVEKIVGKAAFKSDFSEMVSKTSGSLTVALDSDKRKPVDFLLTSETSEFETID